MRHRVPPTVRTDTRPATFTGSGGDQLAARRKELLEDLGAQNLTEAIRSLRRALLVFHSPVDEMVDVDTGPTPYDLLLDATAVAGAAPAVP